MKPITVCNDNISLIFKSIYFFKKTILAKALIRNNKYKVIIYLIVDYLTDLFTNTILRNKHS